MGITRTNNYFKIYKFDFTNSKSKIKDEERKNAIRWERANQMTNFKKSLIDDLSTEKFDQLAKYTHFANIFGFERIEYICSQYGNILFDSFEIGLDMLYKKYGMRYEYHWRSAYFLIPKDQQELIEYFDKNIPEWVVTLKRI